MNLVEEPPRARWEGWPRERWLVALAAEWFFVPHAHEVVAACRYRQSSPLADVRSALHTIWFSFADVCPQLGRALGVVLQSSSGDFLRFMPFEKLLETVLEAHVVDGGKRAELARSLAEVASRSLVEMEADQPALRPLIRPCIALLRDAGLAPGEEPLTPETAKERVSELLFQLESAADDVERSRLRAIIEPLVERMNSQRVPD